LAFWSLKTNERTKCFFCSIRKTKCLRWERQRLWETLRNTKVNPRLPHNLLLIFPFKFIFFCLCWSLWVCFSPFFLSVCVFFNLNYHLYLCICHIYYHFHHSSHCTIALRCLVFFNFLSLCLSVFFVYFCNFHCFRKNFIFLKIDEQNRSARRL
jgi:hypothetical protein